jgi:hypothetical protein
LHAIDEGVVYNYSSRYEPRFAYNSSEAISYMTDVMYENSPDALQSIPRFSLSGEQKTGTDAHVRI